MKWNIPATFACSRTATAPNRHHSWCSSDNDKSHPNKFGTGNGPFSAPQNVHAIFIKMPRELGEQGSNRKKGEKDQCGRTNGGVLKQIRFLSGANKVLFIVVVDFCWVVCLTREDILFLGQPRDWLTCFAGQTEEEFTPSPATRPISRSACYVTNPNGQSPSHIRLARGKQKNDENKSFLFHLKNNW